MRRIALVLAVAWICYQQILAAEGCKSENPLTELEGTWEAPVFDMVLLIDASAKTITLVSAGNVGEMAYEIERCIGSVVMIYGLRGTERKRFALHTGGDGQLGLAIDDAERVIPLKRSR